jgi:hypothetical protein
VWVVVTGYSMTSALGHAALNRLDITGQRQVASANYQDLRADTKRAQEQLTWIPAHRPPDTVTAELNVLKAQVYWLRTKECTQVVGRSAREYCQKFHKLSAELASGLEAQKLETRITEIGAKLAKVAAGGKAVAAADPQASVLARMTGVELESVQTGLALFVALLIEIGSGFGMYVAFAYWRMHGHEPRKAAAVAAPASASVEIEAPERLALPPAEVADPNAAGTSSAAQPPATARLGANDNRTVAERLLPDSDVQRFYREEVVTADGSSITLNDLYSSYCNWSEGQDKDPLAMPTFSREFRALGVRKEKIGGRVRYFDIALRSEQEAASDAKLPATVSAAA